MTFVKHVRHWVIYVIMKTIWPPGYGGHIALGHIMYGYTLLVPMNQRVLNKLSKEHNISSHKWSTTHRVLKSPRSKMSVIYMQSCKHCDHLHYAPCVACWILFGSLVPAVCNCSSCAQVYELPQSHCGDNREGTLFSWLHIYYAHLDSVRFEPSVCRGSLMTTYIMLIAQLVEHSLIHWY